MEPRFHTKLIVFILIGVVIFRLALLFFVDTTKSFSEVISDIFSFWLLIKIGILELIAIVLGEVSLIYFAKWLGHKKIEDKWYINFFFYNDKSNV